MAGSHPWIQFSPLAYLFWESGGTFFLLINRFCTPQLDSNLLRWEGWWEVDSANKARIGTNIATNVCKREEGRRKAHGQWLNTSCSLASWKHVERISNLDNQHVHRHRKQRADHNASKCRQTDRLVGTALVGTTGSCSCNIWQMRISSFQTCQAIWSHFFNHFTSVISCASYTMLHVWFRFLELPHVNQLLAAPCSKWLGIGAHWPLLFHMPGPKIWNSKFIQPTFHTALSPSWVATPKQD